MTKKLIFAAEIIAADADKRTITGRVVPWGSVGNTNRGPVIFERGSLAAPDDLKLYVEHTIPRQVIGRASSVEDREDGLHAVFKIAPTTAGNDALIEADEHLRDGLSVEVDSSEYRFEQDEDDRDVMHVQAGDLERVALVDSPAFTEARVSKVAASNEQPKEAADMPDEAVIEQPVEAAEDPTPVVTATDRPTIGMVTPVTAAEPDGPKLSAGAFMQAQVRAARGDSDARERIEAALAVTNTGTVPGVVPPQFASEIVGVIDSRRRFVEQIEKRPLPGSGMTLQVPVRVTKAGVEIQDLEGDEVNSDAVDIQHLPVAVKTFAGANKVSIQTIERSDPAFLDDLFVQFAEDYAHKSEAYAIAQALAGAVNSVGADVQAQVIQAIADSAGVVRRAPDLLVLGLSGWTALKNERSSGDDRPIFPHMTPQNAPGQLKGTALSGDVEGLAAFVSFDAPTATQAVLPSDAIRFYESARGPSQLRFTQVSTLEMEVGVYGYVAVLPKYPTAVRTLSAV